MTLLQRPGVWSVAILAAGVALWPLEGTAQSEKGVSGMAVSVATSARRCFKDIVPVSGFLEPRNEVQIRPERDGLLISEVTALPGDIIAVGQILLRLADPQTLQDEATIVSPVDGLILETSAVAGAYAATSVGDPLFRILANNELELKADALPADMTKMKVGQTVAIQTPGAAALTGKLRAVDQAFDSVTQLGIVRIQMPGDTRLRSGTFLRAEIETGERCGVSVPLSSILYASGGPVVETVRNGRVEVRSVTIGVVSGNDVEIRTGLGEGETVIARAGGFLREGDPVRPVTGATPAR